MQKNRFYFVAYGLLAVAAILIVLVACGEGMIKPAQEAYSNGDVELQAYLEIVKDEEILKGCIKKDQDGVPYLADDEKCERLKSSASAASSSSEDGTSSNSGGDGGTSSSNDESGASSSSEGGITSSNSEEPSSSSTGPTVLLKCNYLEEGKNIGTPGKSIDKPTVKCGDQIITTGISFRTTNLSSSSVSFSFENPSAGTYLLYAISGDCGGQPQDVYCDMLTIGVSSSSAAKGSSSSAAAGWLNCALPPTSTVGVQIILANVVTCGAPCTCTSVTWSDSKITPAWLNSPTIGTINNITVTGSGGSNCRDIPCGSITINSSNSGGGGTSSASSGGGDCSRSGWCDYGPDNCHEMPTKDCCADGTIVNSQSACSTAASTEYCNYGECKGGDGWNCNSGGGCYVRKAGDTCSGGSVVKTCPAGTCAPSATHCAK